MNPNNIFLAPDLNKCDSIIHEVFTIIDPLSASIHSVGNLTCVDDGNHMSDLLTIYGVMWQLENKG